jgi:glycine/D-amino acid oxidase-like deaminating enzyme
VTTTPDVLVVGAGVLGAAIAYESAKRGLRTLLVDRGEVADGATRWSTAGVAWLAHVGTPVEQLTREGWARHRSLSAELGSDTGFRQLPTLALAPSAAEMDRLCALAGDARAAGFAADPVDPDDLPRLEPMLAPGSAFGGVRFEQAHVEPVRLTRAFADAALREGAELRAGVDVWELVVGGGMEVETQDGRIVAGKVVLAAGAWTNRLLRRAGLPLGLLHTHAETIETEAHVPVLRHLVLGADDSRAALETTMGSPELRQRWETECDEPLCPPAIELGAVQFMSGRLRLGQVSRAVTGFLGRALPDGEELIRERFRRFFPTLADIPGELHGRPVAISADRLPIAGPFDAHPDLYVVGGMVSPLVFAPSLAARLAAQLAGDDVPELAPFHPDRLAPAV